MSPSLWEKSTWVFVKIHGLRLVSSNIVYRCLSYLAWMLPQNGGGVTSRSLEHCSIDSQWATWRCPTSEENPPSQSQTRLKRLGMSFRGTPENLSFQRSCWCFLHIKASILYANQYQLFSIKSSIFHKKTGVYQHSYFHGPPKSHNLWVDSSMRICQEAQCKSRTWPCGGHEKLPPFHL